MTGCERILHRLEQGPATAAELYASTYSIVHSRIADLRRRGYVIECEHLGGSGASAHLYRLISSPQEAAGEPSDRRSPSVAVEGASSTSPAAQLSLV